MRPVATTFISLRALKRNKMRSILTALGIIIGVGAVISIVSIGNGAKAQVEAQIASLGQNVVLIFSGNFTQGGVRSGYGGAGTLTPGDADAIESEVRGVSAVSPEVRSRAQVLANGLNWNTQILGEGPDYLTIRSWPIVDGNMFADTDVRGAAKVCVVGQTIVTQLFPNEEPVGKIIRIRNIPFKILGVLKAKGLSVQGQDQDDLLIIPIKSAMTRISKATNVGTINVQIESPDVADRVEAEMTALLRQRHRIEGAAPDDFTIRGQQEIAAAADASTKTMRALLIGIALVSLVVGGIGIMNIMLVSVTERTREIGIRMAVGAHGSDIQLQFLIEALILSLMGGILGILAGVGASQLMTVLNGWATLVSIDAVIYAFIVSGLVGVAFGFYPAYKAAQLDPIDALRYE